MPKKIAIPILALILAFCVFGHAPARGQTAADPSSTPPAFVAITTATPNADGSVVHVVGPGETLWQIALSYGVKIDDIRTLNNLPAGFTDIREGERLIIHPAGAITPPATASSTPTIEQSPTSTHVPTNTRTPRPPTATKAPTLTPTLSPTPTQPPFLSPERKDTKTIAVLLFTGSMIGIVLVLFFGFRKGK